MTVSSTSGTSSMDSSWVSLIDNTITAEKQQRLDTLTQQSSDLETRQAIFTDLSSQISELKSSLGSLWSTNGSYVLSGARSTSVTNPSVTGTKVLTASASSSAGLGSYTIDVTNIATQHRVASTASTSSSTAALGYSGGFSISVGGKAHDFTVATSDTLYSIASKINSATYDTNKGVSASVVNNRLVFQSTSSGADYKMTFGRLTTDSNQTDPLDASNPLVLLGVVNADKSFVSNGTTQSQLQDGVDAKFKVNGVSVTRSSNTGLTDVISGVTLNLATDANNNSATLTIQSNTASLKNALQTFITKYNSLQTYIANKTGFTKVDDKHYTAGALANDISIMGLKSDLQNLVSSSTGSGTVKYLADLGLSLDDNQLSIKDSTKLDDALSNNSTAVTSFLDTKMSKMDSILGTYVGSDNSFVTYSLKSMDQRKTELTTSITAENTRLDARRQALVAYYQTLDTTMNQLLQQQKTNTAWLSAMYSSTSTSA